MTPATAMGDMLPAWVPLATITAIKNAGIFVSEANSMHGAASKAQMVMAPGPRDDNTKARRNKTIGSRATLPRTPLTANFVNFSKVPLMFAMANRYVMPANMRNTFTG